jgi:hypothetical protein
LAPETQRPGDARRHCATDIGLVARVGVLAVELGETTVTANILDPGLTLTALVDASARACTARIRGGVRSAAASQGLLEPDEVA